MQPLAKALQRQRRNPLSLLAAIGIATLVFGSMAVTQLNIKYVTPEPEPELLEFHLPPPPPPTPSEKPPEQTNVSINFDLPVTPGPGDVPLGFLNVDFGLSTKQLTESSLNVSDTIESYKTDELQDLEVYDYKDVTEKPSARFKPPISIPPRLTGGKNVDFEVIAFYLIDKEGRVSNVHIIDIPYPDAIPMISKWLTQFRYTSPKRNGKEVNMLIRVRFTYRASSGNPFSL